MATAAALLSIYGLEQGFDLVVSLLIAGLQLTLDAQYSDLSKKYQNVYKTQRDIYNSNFQINGEAVLLNQVFTNPLAGNGQPGTMVYTPQYLGQVQNIENFNEQAGGGAFSDDVLFPPASPFPNGWWGTHARMYNDLPYDYSNDPRGFNTLVGEPVALDKAATVADFDNYFYRYEEHRKDVYDERTWEWQNQSLNFGVKQASVVESGLATSFKFIDEAEQNMSDWSATQLNGIARKHSFINEFQESTKRLNAATERGRALAISTNLGMGDTLSQNSDSIMQNGFDQSRRIMGPY